MMQKIRRCGIHFPIQNMYTVWKFHDFSITQILREINFGESRSAKSATLTQLKALNFDFYAFLPLLRLKLTKITKFRMAKMAVL